MFSSGFLSLGTIGMFGWRMLHREGCPVHCRMFSNIAGLYPLDASITRTPPHSYNIGSVSRGCQNVLLVKTY